MARSKKTLMNSKTVWVNIILAVSSLVSGLGMIDGIVLPVWVIPVVTLVANVVLRAITTEPTTSMMPKKTI